MKTQGVYIGWPRRAFVSLLLATFVVALVVGSSASSQTKPGPAAGEEQTRARIAEAVGKGDYTTVNKLFSDMAAKKAAASEAAVSGSVFFEEIRACGFYPQETRLECVIDIKQDFGYAGPIETSGSTEHVYFCVDWNNNGVFEPTESVGQGSVVMHDNAAKTNYAVYRDINVPGMLRTTTSAPGVATTTTKALIFNAQATLSWVMPPTGCNFSPVWGNVFRFRIRLDPIR
jgi:hypothetical protein